MQKSYMNKVDKLIQPHSFNSSAIIEVERCTNYLSKNVDYGEIDSVTIEKLIELRNLIIDKTSSYREEKNKEQRRSRKNPRMVVCQCCGEQLDQCHIISHLLDSCESFAENSLEEECTVFPTEGRSLYQVIPGSYGSVSVECNACKYKFAFWALNDHDTSYQHEASIRSSTTKWNTHFGYCAFCHEECETDKIYEHINSIEHINISAKKPQFLLSVGYKFVVFKFDVRCLLCKKSFPRMRFLDHVNQQHAVLLDPEHYQHDGNATRMFCVSCDEIFNDLKSYKLHSAEHNKKFPFSTVCRLCGKQTRRGETIQHHLKFKCFPLQSLTGKTKSQSSSLQSDQKEKETFNMLHFLKSFGLSP